ncbi:hypothetical protein [Qaidamihabitans albus]|uniref:hypothetical protein n=1 Tax=Qaidamihabitans albus TaxID=2795733 RepID=UPI0018F269CC|nr:hypothetical protein [Qaidamihabitans albus]
MSELISGPSSASAPHVRIDLPPGFTGQPVVGSPEGEDSVRLFGRFAVGGDAPEPATFSLAVVELTRPGAAPVAHLTRDRGLVAEALRAQYQQHRPEADTRVIDLTIGPALAAVTAAEYRLPPEMSGHSREVVRPVFRIEVQIPAPDGRHLVVVDVTTESEADWPAVAEETVRIANSIRVEPRE